MHTFVCAACLEATNLVAALRELLLVLCSVLLRQPELVAQEQLLLEQFPSSLEQGSILLLQLLAETLEEADFILRVYPVSQQVAVLREYRVQFPAELAYPTSQRVCSTRLVRAWVAWVAGDCVDAGEGQQRRGRGRRTTEDAQGASLGQLIEDSVQDEHTQETENDLGTVAAVSVGNDNDQGKVGEADDVWWHLQQVGGDKRREEEEKNVGGHGCRLGAVVERRKMKVGRMWVFAREVIEEYA